MSNRQKMTLKPRNPLVALARFRRAGAHAPRTPSRQAERMQLRKEMTDLKLDS